MLVELLSFEGEVNATLMCCLDVGLEFGSFLFAILVGALDVSSVFSFLDLFG